MRLSIDTETDTYEQAIAAVQAAYGLRPDVPDDWPMASAAEPRLGPEALGSDDIGDGWTEQGLFRMVASLMPRARAGCAASWTWAVLPRTTTCSSTSPTIPQPPSRL